MRSKNDLQELSEKAVLTVISPKESSLLELLRAGSYCKIEIHLKAGAITQIYAEDEVGISGANIQEIVNRDAYQSVTITRVGGDLTRIKRRIPIKL